MMLLVFAVVVCAQKKYEKYIRKYDVVQYLPERCDSNPSTFWRTIVNNNPVLKENIGKMTNPKGSMKEAMDKVQRINSENALRDQSLPKMDLGPLNEMLNAELLDAGEDDPVMTFCVLDKEEWNAGCTPDGHVYINYGLVKKLGKSDEMLFGVLAHEITHFMLKHTLMHIYRTLKREKTNNVVAGVAVLGMGVGSMAAAGSGYYDPNMSQRYQDVLDGAKESTNMFYYRYGRDEELEADIVAYRFLEWIGIDPSNYIKALGLIDLDNLTGAGKKDSDHPSTAFRVELLRQLIPAGYKR